MAKIIKTITFNFKWSGDCTALRGFNVSLTTQGKTPTEESIIAIHIDETEIKPTYSCVLKNITLDSSTIYTAWVQACYPGKDSDWKSSGNLTASDDGSSTIASQTQLNTTNTNVSNVTNKVTNLQQTGLGMKVNFSSFTLVDPGEIYLHGFNPVTGASEDIDGWVWWNGAKVTIPKGMINPNDFIYNNPIYVVYRTSNSTKYQVAYFTDQKKWKYTTTPTKGTVSDWTWNPTTDIILCSFIEPSNEGSLVSSLLYTPPKSAEDVTVSNEINNKIKDVQDNLDNFDNTITGTFRDGIIEEAEAKAIKQNLNIIQTDKAQLDKDYSTVYGNSKLDGTTKTNLSSAKTDYDSKYNTLVNTVNNAIADGKATTEEATAVNNAFTNYKTSIGTLKQRLQESLDYISTKKIDDLVIGGRNILLDSGRIITTTTAYNVAIYKTSSLKPNTKYTFVINGFTNSGNTLGVWFNSGNDGGIRFPTTTLAKTQYAVVTTPGTLNSTTVYIYNYPQSTATNSTINWACMYEGEIKPPLDWSPSPEDINNTISALGEDLQDQIDGKIESYNQTTNPADAWTTAAIKTQHTGDIWYNDSTKLTQRWSGSAWMPLKDADAIAAQNLAQQKKRVFTATPTTPYDVGDLWVQGGTGDIMKCKTSLASGSYNAAHWEKASKYTDDTTANQAVSNTILTPADKISFLATYKDALKANESLSSSASLLDLVNDPTYKTSYVPAYNALKSLLEVLVGDVSKQNSTTVGWDKAGYDTAYDKYVSARENFEKRIKDEIYKYANGEKGVSYENEKLLASWCADNNKLLINGGKIYLKSISGESLMMNTITAGNIAIGDFTNYVTANPNIPDTTKFSHTPYGEPHISDNYLCKANASDLYFGLTDTSLNSFSDDDELYFEFTGRAASATTVTVIISARDKNKNYLFDRQSEAITLTTTDKVYSGTIKLTGSWSTSPFYNIGISNTAATKVQVFAKNVIIRKKNAGNMIVDGSVTATKMNVKGLTVSDGSKNTLAIDNAGNVSLDVKSLRITGSAAATQSEAQGYASSAKSEAISAAASDATTKANNAKTDALNAAKTYTDNGLGNKLDASWMTQKNIFDKLTNNGALQGIYMEGGKLYINGEYIKANSIDADRLIVGMNPNLVRYGMDTMEQYTEAPYFTKASSAGVNITHSTSYTGTRCIDLSGTSTNNYVYLGNKDTDYGCVPVTAGKRYIISCYVKNDSSVPAPVSLGLIGHTSIDANNLTFPASIRDNITNTDGWKRLSVKYLATSSVPYISLKLSVEIDRMHVYFDAFQIEEVNDVNKEPGAFKQAGTSIIDGGNITTGIIKDSANNFNLNLATGVITAKKLSINSTNFTLSETGVITAKSGYIGNGSSGFTIGSTSIYNGMSSLSSAATGIYLGTDGISLGGGKFKVDKDGITKATSGVIGGWNITTGSMNRQFTANNKNYWLYFDTGTTSDAYAAFMLRTKATTSSAWEDKFSVAWNGRMTAMDADVRGVINATSLQAKDDIKMYSALTAAPATVLELVKHGSATATYDTLFVGDGLDPNSYLDIRRRTEFAEDVLIKSGNLAVVNNISASSIYTSNWFRSRGKTGWYSEDYAGGIRMEDASWVRTYGDKNFYCNKIIYAGTNLQVDGTAQIRTINYNGEVNIISRGSQLVKGGAVAEGGSWFGSTAIYNRTYTGQSDVCITSSGVVGRRTSSSKRYKKDISYLSHPENSTVKEKSRLTRSRSTLRPEAVLNIPVADYKYVDGYVTGGDYEGNPILGFIAEDVEKAFPDAVIYNTVFKDTITNEIYEASKLDILSKIREDLLSQTIESLLKSYRKEHNLLGSGMIGDPVIMNDINEKAKCIVDKTNPDIASRCVEIVDYNSPERWDEKVIIPAMLYVAQQQRQHIKELNERISLLEITLSEK